MKYLISVDAGTTSFKGAVFDENGKMITTHNCSYELLTAEESIVEFRVEGYNKAFFEIISTLFEKSGINPDDVEGLSIDSQGETLICLDHNGKPLRNAIVWLDNRAVDEAKEIEDVFGVQKVYEITGQPEIVPTWPACKILWIKKNQPEVFEKTAGFLLLEDYLIYILTGKYAAEKSLLTSTIYFDINTGRWWKDMLDFIGLDEERLPAIYHSGVPVGKVTERASREFGLSQGTTIVTGALDQLAGLIGSGIAGEDKACETTGTCMAVCIPVSGIPEFKQSMNVPCHAGALDGEYYQIYWSQTAGAVLEWFKNNFYCDLKGSKDIFTIIDEESAQVPAGSQGLVMLPHLSGMACPEFNSDAKGVFYGIRLLHERKHFSRAIMESVAYMLKEHITATEQNRAVFDEIRSLGGGSKSRLWNQIKADVTGKKIVTLKNSESTCLGTAILAGVGIGMFSSIQSAVEKLVRPDCEFIPDYEKQQQYVKGYEAYIEIYQKLRKTFSNY